MDESVIKNVCDHYELKGEYSSYGVIKNGNINQTFIVETKYKNPQTENITYRRYVFQCINSYVFNEPEKLVKNIMNITKHIESRKKNLADSKRKSLRVYITREGKGYYCDQKGRYWRVINYIYDAISCDRSTPLVMEKTGEAFGEFQAMLLDYPMDELYIPIPDFHNTEKRYNNLVNAAKADEYGRLAEIKEDYEYLMGLSEYASFFKTAHENGQIPLRVTHNDTKCNNVMFDSKTMEPLTVIDLDTVMPGFAAHDFGDAVRFGASTAAEDEEDLNKVALDMELFESFCKGYLTKLSGHLNPFETETLPIGAIAITYELSMRFLTDYLEGDKYFITRKPNHNFYRVKCQTKLLWDMINKLNDMKTVVKKYL